VTPWLDKVYAEVDARASRHDRAEPVARRALLTGVYVSAAILSAGLLIMFLQAETRPNDPPSIAQMFRGAGRLRGVCLVYLGLLLLAATPILRVIAMVGVYVRRREWFMVVVSAVVLALLTVGLVLGTG